jgi:hypothetical protein
MEKEIYGIFDGQCFVAADGTKYPVAGNYASKSQLLEGDALKLIIDNDGDFFYKQVGPVPRKRIIAKVIVEDGCVMIHNNTELDWRILPSSATFFKVKKGDEVIARNPPDKPAFWAAIEMVTTKKPSFSY